MSIKVYIAISLDGYIADKNNNIDWLDMVPMTKEVESEFTKFIDCVDCLIMGKNTFETVVGFGGEWVYTKKVFVISASMTSIPNGYEDKAELIKGCPTEIIKNLNKRGFENFYIDGGITIQSFLKEDLVDEIILSTIPILLGGGKSLFGELSNPIKFKLIGSKVVSGLINQSHYKRVESNKID